MNIKELKEFLVEVHKSTYAETGTTGTVKEIREKDGSKTLTFEKGDFSCHDNYFGGEPFGGREVVFYKEKPVWMMTYYGRVIEKGIDVQIVYDFLRNALKTVPSDYPYRGDQKYIENELVYKNDYKGEVDNFFGKEEIYKNNQLIYEARYAGGLVDVKMDFNLI